MARIAPPQGVPARPAVPGDDPRWQRPLPWVGPVEPYADPLVLLAVGATMINLVYSCCDPLVGHSKTILEHAAAAGAYRSWSRFF